MKSLKGKSLKGVSLAMGIFTSFFTQNSEAFPKQKDVLQVISQVRTVSENVYHCTEQPRAVFTELVELTKTISLLNAVVRSMRSPEKVIEDMFNIDTVLDKLSKHLRTVFYTHLRDNLDDRVVFKQYSNEVFRFSVFVTKLRQETGNFVIVPSVGNPTQTDLDVLVEDSNERYRANG